MAAETSFDYYYGDESNQFSFYRIPRQLVTGERFKRLSMDAKLLYGLLLDRMSLSAKNGWYDGQGRVYIYYTLDEIQEDLNCGHDKATRMLVELDNGKNGFGLIERVRQGQGRPTKIYVKRFTTRAVPPPAARTCAGAFPQAAAFQRPRLRKSRSPECSHVMKLCYLTSALSVPTFSSGTRFLLIGTRRPRIQSGWRWYPCGRHGCY